MRVAASRRAGTTSRSGGWGPLLGLLLQFLGQLAGASQALGVVPVPAVEVAGVNGARQLVEAHTVWSPGRPLLGHRHQPPSDLCCPEWDAGRSGRASHCVDQVSFCQRVLWLLRTASMCL